MVLGLDASGVLPDCLIEPINSLSQFHHCNGAVVHHKTRTNPFVTTHCLSLKTAQKAAPMDHTHTQEFLPEKTVISELCRLVVQLEVLQE